MCSEHSSFCVLWTTLSVCSDSSWFTHQAVGSNLIINPEHGWERKKRWLSVKTKCWSLCKHGYCTKKQGELFIWQLSRGRISRYLAYFTFFFNSDVKAVCHFDKLVSTLLTIWCTDIFKPTGLCCRIFSHWSNSLCVLNGSFGASDFFWPRRSNWRNTKTVERGLRSVHWAVLKII